MAEPTFLRDRSNPCVRAANPDAFFPNKGGKPHNAVALCRSGCRNINKCLDYAIQHNITEGIWGGTTPQQRRPMVRAAGTGGNQARSGRRSRWA